MAQDPDDDVPSLRLGPVEVHPSLALTETWKDNILAVDVDEKSDFLTSIKPGLGFRLPYRMHTFSLDGNIDFVRFAKYSEEDKTYYEAGAMADLNFGSKINFNLSERFVRSYEPRLESTDGTSDRYDTNTAKASVKYTLAEVSQVKLEYSMKAVRYELSDFRSVDENLLSAYFFYQVQPKTSLFLQYDYKIFDYVQPGSPFNSGAHSGMIGAKWEISAKSNGTVKAGFQAKNYRDADVKDFSTWVASADFSTELSDMVTLTVSAKRDVLESKLEDVRYFVTNAISGAVKVQFLEQISGNAKVAYNQDKYSDPAADQINSREDKIVSAGLGLEYTYQPWLKFSLDYLHRSKDSSNPDTSPVENQVALKITAAL